MLASFKDFSSLFFNDTATTEIYTLSLHDALPLSAAGKRRHFCRSCLDWTERRAHIGGAVGAALANRCFDLGWTERMKDSRAVIVTASGKQGFLETFGFSASEDRQISAAPSG